MNKTALKNKNDVIDYMIIGNSAAGLAAAESIREIDGLGKIQILTGEEHHNYSKPLITYYLAGKVSLDNIYFKDKKFYKENSLDVDLKAKVKSLDTRNSSLVTEDGREYRFKKLLIASGGKPIIPEIKLDNSYDSDKGPPEDTINSINYKKINGIFTLATLGDAIKIKKYREKNNIDSICILGGGLIGLKAAEAFLEIGINVNIIELSDRILSATFDHEASGIIERIIEDRGSKIYKKNTVDRIFAKNEKINSIKLIGGEKIECKLLIMAIGVTPDTSFINEGDLKTGRGILVDDNMQTSIKNIYAAGDIVEGFDRLVGKSKNIAIWPLAIKQGIVAGVNMAGKKRKYPGGFFMNSVEILGTPSISLGITNIEEDKAFGIEIVREFRPQENRYKKIVIRDNKIIGAILVGNIERAGIYPGLIGNEVNLSGVKEHILKEDFGIIHLPVDYKKHLVVGEGVEV